jgi:RNA polymerase sigma factor (sigma-70 family)
LSPADAEDLVQETFIQLVQNDLLARADASRGRFRSYLLGIAKNLLNNERRRERAQKRGGTHKRLSLDAAMAVPTPEPGQEEFDLLWFRHLVTRSLEALRERSPRRYETLSLSTEQKLPYEKIAETLGCSLQQVKNDIFRARAWLTRELKAEVARYVSSDEEYREEMSYLAKFLGDG